MEVDAFLWSSSTDRACGTDNIFCQLRNDPWGGLSALQFMRESHAMDSKKGRGQDIQKGSLQRQKWRDQDPPNLANPGPGLESQRLDLESRGWLKTVPVLHHLLEFTNWLSHPTISSSIAHFPSCPQSFPASGSFPVSRLFASCGQRIRASASVLPMNIQGWLPLGLIGLISLQSKGLSKVFSRSTIWKHQLFSDQPSLGLPW